MDTHSLLPFEPDSGNTFSDYIERLEFYFESVDLDLSSVFPSDPDYQIKLDRLHSKRRAVLLSSCGSKCFEVLKSVTQPRSVKELTFEELTELALNHFDSSRNPIKGRYEFGRRVRGEYETFSRFHKALEELAKECCFGKMLEERVRDQILVGVGDERVVEELISDKNLSYQDAINICSRLDEKMKGN